MHSAFICFILFYFCLCIVICTVETHTLIGERLCYGVRNITIFENFVSLNLFRLKSTIRNTLRSTSLEGYH